MDNHVESLWIYFYKGMAGKNGGTGRPQGLFSGLGAGAEKPSENRRKNPLPGAPPGPETGDSPPVKPLYTETCFLKSCVLERIRHNIW